MKKTLLVIAVLFTASGVFAQNLTITYDATKGVSALVGSPSVYLHSGGNDEAGPLDATVWKYVVGNWGADDGIGKMTSAGTDLWTIDVGDAVAYYSQASNGPVAGTAIFRLGMVFRDAAGALKGGDVAGNDIFADVSTSTPSIVNSTDGTPFDGVVIAVSTGVGTIQPNDVLATAYPNPVSAQGIIAYTLGKQTKGVTLSVYNSIGQMVNRDVKSNLGAGTYFVHYDASNYSNGIYSYTLEADGKAVSNKFVVAK